MLAAVRSDELRRRVPRSSRPNSLALASRGPAQLMEARVRAIMHLTRETERGESEETNLVRPPCMLKRSGS